jgi:hypothetical protein
MIKRYKRTLLSGWTEYNRVKCTEISEGAWTVQTPLPQYGATSLGTVTGRLANGDCPGHTFTFAAIYYTWNVHNNKAIQDAVNAVWQTPDGKFAAPLNSMPQVPIVRPVGETTAAAGWDSAGSGLWKQTLHPPADDPKFDFSFDLVQESDPGGGGPDTCWFSGSAFAPFTSITGGTWAPDSKDVWKYDHVGWFTTAITYYRSKKRAPCGTKFPQQMQHEAQNVETSFVNYGPVNTLGGSFTKTTATSKRAGKSQTRTR